MKSGVQRATRHQERKILARGARKLGLFGALCLAVAMGVPSGGFAADPIIYDSTKGAALARELVANLRMLTPEANYTNTGILKIKAKRQPLVNVAYTCRLEVTQTNWTSHYSAMRGTNALPGFSVEHRPNAAVIYRSDTGAVLSEKKIHEAFAGSDFWLSDLALDFFNWPAQRVLKWEMRRHSGCKVLESRNPNPESGGYSRVVSWIHDESLGIVQAEAYDARGKLLKEFRPTELQMVNGRRELKEMEIENIQTDSTTRLVFDL